MGKVNRSQMIGTLARGQRPLKGFKLKKGLRSIYNLEKCSKGYMKSRFQGNGPNIR